MKEIRAYEEEIFTKYRENSIELRVKGRLQFKDMTISENINYLKYNIKSVEDTLKMVYLFLLSLKILKRFIRLGYYQHLLKKYQFKDYLIKKVFYIL